MAFALADHQREARIDADERTEVAEMLTSVATRLQTNLNGDVMLLQGIVAGIAVNPGMSEDDFEKLTSQILRTPSQIKIVTAAPNLVVKWIHPAKGNESVIGLDYRVDKQQHDGAMAARNTHNIVLVGPIHLVQGGIGFIVRTPVYFTDGNAQTFWGLLSGVIDIPKLYADGGLADTDLDIAISSTFDTTSAKDVFYGDPSMFSGNPVLATLDMGYGKWTIGGIPKSGWGAHNNSVVFRLLATTICLAVIVPMFWAGALARSRQKTIARLTERELELVSARQSLEYQSLHDPLTDLPNRRYLDHLLAAAPVDPGKPGLSLIHLDLDAFKEVNDSKGHAGGDHVLRTTASRLREAIGPEDVAMRIGGDEFVVATRNERPRAVISLARTIVRQLALPITVDGEECVVGASAGVAWETPREDITSVLGNADLALYQAKKEGRGRAKVFSKKLREAVREAKRLGDEIAAAIEENQLVPYFQPQFDANSHAIAGVEALVRWDHPTRGVLSPAQFLSVAEERGLSSAIDKLVLQRSLFELSRWDASGIYVPRVSVNVSAQRLAEIAHRTELSTLVFQRGRLCFELLESISFDGQSRSVDASIQNIKDAGIDIEIDDFGTGHASILSLLRLRPRRLKIDREIVLPVVESMSQRRLVSSIIEIGRSQNIEIIAEGIETMDHAKILRDLGCHILQGYAFARPMSGPDFTKFCAARQSATQNVA